ncbi:MAG: methyltransferase domain-containing protein [Solirubrobacteraceae bacterium]|jgi:SAM-dependent methyltransferase
MRDALLEHLRCPSCHSERCFALSISHHDGREARDGTLTCSICAARFPLRAGVVELLGDPPEQIAREAAGLERFAEVMRADGWDRERIRNLPYEDLPYWWGQRRAFEYWSEQLPFAPGQWLLDVGSSTCWASAMFAERGLSVIALDIATAELQGLHTADYFISDGSLFFERVLSSMNEPAIASESVDYVFCCEALHHNAPDELRQTLAEFHRILRPGGSLMLVNEPLRFPLKLKRDHGSEVAQFEGNEHVYFLHEYLLAARRAGFEVQIRWPRNLPRPTPDTPAPEPPAPAGGAIRRTLARSRLARQACVAWRLAVSGDASLNLLCRKPG